VIVIYMDVGTIVKTPEIIFENYYYTYGGMQGGMMNESKHNREQWLGKIGIVTEKQSAGRRRFPDDDMVAVFFPHNREVLYIKAEDLETIRIPNKGEVV